MAVERPVAVDPEVDEPAPTDGSASTVEPARRGLRRRPQDLVLVGLLLAYVAARASIAARVEPFRTYDSRSYAGLLDGSNPTATVSFTGHAPRLWGTPLLYALAGSDPARALAQALVGTVAWSVLAVALWFSLRTLTARVVATVLLLGLALTPAAYVWDHTLISESLSINLGLLAFGLLAIWVRTRSRVVLVATTLVVLWWIFVRQDMLLFVGLVVLVLAGLAWRSRPHRRAAAAALVAVLAGLAWNVAILGPTDHTFAKWSASGYSQTEETFLYRLMVQVMDDPQMRRTYYQDLGMPRCRPMERATAPKAWRIGAVSQAYTACPALRAWSDEHRMSVGYRYALADPRHYAWTMEQTLPAALGSTALHTYGKPVPLLPDGVVQAVYFPAAPRVLPTLGGITLVAVLACLLTGALRRRRRLVVVGVVGGLTSVASVLASLMLSAGEYTRFGIQESLYLRISLLVLLVAALDAALTRRAERTVGPAGPGEEPDPAAAEQGRPEPATVSSDER
ncbi:hypothetical protein ACFO0M_02045 [Micromonospora mangrovi]|uniref:Glycosyltransferase RgtA/B/C/D-like domain-containing protein n=2 Tax=Micromonospora TaxID=1873 RepID=A0AAU7MGG7_9ACTN